MTKLSRKVTSAVQVGVLGIALFAGAGAACTNGDGYDVVGGPKSTDVICGELGGQLPPLVGSVLASALTIGLHPDPTPDQQAQDVNATRASFHQLATVLRAEAGVAADPGLASALADTAEGIDAQGAKIRTESDIEAIDRDSVDTSKLNPYCPDLAGRLGA
jgi:hypothetical protein